MVETLTITLGQVLASALMVEGTEVEIESAV